ncbi:hypothetical protein SNEBB_002061 [Seison nebaliae]|nr:hypothetical protein SNEBB_002061 [Seison nebaliae]
MTYQRNPNTSYNQFQDKDELERNLSNNIQKLKHVAIQIHGELEEQQTLLESMNEGFSKTIFSLGQSAKKLLDVNTYSRCSNWIYLFFFIIGMFLFVYLILI